MYKYFCTLKTLFSEKILKKSNIICSNIKLDVIVFEIGVWKTVGINDFWKYVSCVLKNEIQASFGVENPEMTKWPKC